MNVLRSTHRCAGCGAEDAAVGASYEQCDDCDRRYRKGWGKCETCGLLTVPPFHGSDECDDCKEKREAAEQERLYLGAPA